MSAGGTDRAGSPGAGGTKRRGTGRADASEGLPAGFVADLRGAGIRVLTDPEVLAGPSRDWTGRWVGALLGMVRPRSTEQVRAVVAGARRHGVALHVQGGNTGLVGGSVPAGPALLLVTAGLTELGPVDRVQHSVVAGAGVTCARLAAHARAAGLHFGVDLAARDSATVGGMAATNAGGLGVVAFGMMRGQVRGVRAVLADGRLIDTVGRPVKDNTGYDLTGLLIGSEGTLGVITTVEVGLHPRPAASSVALLAARDLATAAALARTVQSSAARLLAAEVVDRAGVTRAAAAAGIADPLQDGDGWALLLDVADGGSGEGLAAVADQVSTFASDAADRARLWALRERQTELYSALPSVEKLDIAVRVRDLDELVVGVRGIVGQTGGADAPATRAAPAGWVGFFGHVLDGNLHVQLVGARPGAAEEVLGLVSRLGGSISAEHGIGRMKAAHLHLVRSADEVATMRSIKDAIDPQHLLNAGVLLLEGRDVVPAGETAEGRVAR